MPHKHIDWDDEYNLGIESIDAQHRHLFEIVNMVYDLEENDHVKDEIRTILEELNDYMKTHFKDEEIYLENIHFPELEEHKLLHANIIEQLTQVVKNPHHRLDIFQTKMKVIVKRLLIDHIVIQDMKIKHYLKRRISKQK